MVLTIYQHQFILNVKRKIINYDIIEIGGIIWDLTI